MSPFWRVVVAVVSVLGCWSTVPALASADSSGATRYDYTYCSPPDPSYSYCEQGTTLFSFASTPSGREVVTYHNSSTYSYSDNFSGSTCTTTGSQRNQTTYLLTPDSTGAYQGTSHRRYTMLCADGTPVTCESTDTFTVANNELREVNTTTRCQRGTAATTAKAV